MIFDILGFPKVVQILGSSSPLPNSLVGIYLKSLECASCTAVAISIFLYFDSRECYKDSAFTIRSP